MSSSKLISMLLHPDEIVPLLQMALAAKRAQLLPKDPSLAFCYDMLNKVSRSFAVVIQQLPEVLRDPVCIFYLVLRALDTIEDDMALPVDTKLPLLLAFHEHIYDRTWSMSCGEGAYVRLMEQYPLVTDAFLNLAQPYQKVITDITRRMGAGMAEFIPKQVISTAEYDKYCHYVAGLVGIGLSQLFASGQLESPEFANMEELSNHMGLFLQKTNIIRDYLEDIDEKPAPRMFWPKEIWGRFADSLDVFKAPSKSKEALECLNAMVTDALQHLPYSLHYMDKIQNQQIFRFCAIPQVMAIGTLAMCYNNHKVFTGVVKMRRGETAKYMGFVNTHGNLFAAFQHFVSMLSAKVGVSDCQVDSPAVAADPSLVATKKAVAQAQLLCKAGLQRNPAQRSDQSAWLVLLLAVFVAFFCLRIKNFFMGLQSPAV